MKKQIFSAFGKTNKVNKKLMAVLLSAIMIVGSLPIALAAGPGTYDPTPVFTSDASAAAYLLDDGGVHVMFSAATAREYPGKEPKTISYYLLSLYNLGSTLSLHQRVLEYEKTVTVTDASSTYYSLNITAAELSAKSVTLSDNNRYNIRITAVDSTGWVSEPIDCAVTDTPRFEYDADAYAPLTENEKAMREMMIFESGGTPTGQLTGSSLALSGIGTRDGVIDPSTGLSSSALRFYINNRTGGVTQAFTTPYSRQTYDFEGAEEVWFWMDLSQVSVTGLSFDLKTNAKLLGEFYYRNKRAFGGHTNGRDTSLDDGVVKFDSGGTDQYSPVTYSTLGTTASGYKGEAPYVFIQQENGGWQKVMLNNGTIDLSHYKGYIRVPLEFMCSTKNTYAEATNLNFNMVDTVCVLNRENDGAEVKAWFENNILYSQPVLVDEAGTSVSDAMLIQYRQFAVDKSTDYNPGGASEAKWHYPYDYASGDYAYMEYPTWGAAMLAAGYKMDEADTNSTADRAYIQNGTVLNRENGLKAINDLYSAGFSYKDTSDESVNKSFFMDNVLFYRTDGQPYTENTLDGNEKNTGDPASKYYEQKEEIANSILSEIDHYLSSPDLADFGAVRYIEELIEGYRTAFSQAGVSTDFLSEDSLAALAASQGRESWNNFITARKECWAAGTITPNDPDNPTASAAYPTNITAYDLVPELIRSMEKLPDPSNVTSVSDQLNDEIQKLYQLYRRLNLTQLDALSTAEEQELLSYFALMSSGSSDSEMDVVGQSLANNKFIVFNDFDAANQTQGSMAWQLENYPNLGSGVYGQDYRYTKGFLTYTTKRFRGFTGADSDATGSLGSYSWSYPIVDGFRRSSGTGHTADTDPLYVNQMLATIEAGGFNGTNAAVIQLNGQGYSENEGFYNVLSVTYQGQDGTTDSLLNNNMGQFNLGQFANQYNPGSYDETKILPLALAFYADFSQLSDFRLTATITTKDSDGNLTDYTLDMGTDSGDRKYWLLNPDTGEWVCCYSNRIYGFNSSDGAEGLSLDHYKGWVMLPLYHFKGERSGLINEGVGMDESVTALNGICKVQIGVAPNSNAAAVAMTGASYMIDTIGLAYQPDVYPGVTGRNDTDFDEVCQAKSLPAQQFEDAVAAIEINDGLFADDVFAARVQYNTLTEYQRTQVQSVINANERLIYYEKVISGEIPQSEYMYRDEPEAFVAWVNSLPDAVKNASVSGEQDLPYPGYVDNDSDGMADAVNYAAYGITKEQAEQIIEYYNLDYSRYTTAQKQLIGDDLCTQFINAYNAAMRCNETLEKALLDTTEMLNELTDVNSADSIYRQLPLRYPDKAAGTAGTELGSSGQPATVYDKTKPYDGREGYFISLGTGYRDSLSQLNDNYRNSMDYFAKYLMASGEAHSDYKNIPTAIRKLLLNSTTYNINGTTTRAGLLSLYDKYNNLLTVTRNKLASGTSLTEAERQELRDTIEEYDALIPTFYNVAELYDMIQQIRDLFPYAKTTLETSTDSGMVPNSSVILSDENPQTENDMVYTLVDFERYLSDLSGTAQISVWSKNGGQLVAADGSQSPLSYTMTVNGTPFVLNSTETPYVSVGPAADSGSYSLTLRFSVDSPASVTAALSDEVYIKLTYEYVDSNGINRKYEDLKTVSVTYASDDSYVVTIPAEIGIPWGSESTNIGYQLNCNLNAGSEVQVSVAFKQSAFDLTNTGTSEVISCTSSVSAPGVYTGKATVNRTDAAQIQVEASQWVNKPVAEYRQDAAVTYTVNYTKG